jgi:hypothetical protein
MRLLYLPVNACWVFMFGTQIVRMGEGALFHRDRQDAIFEAALCGLQIADDNTVEAVNGC